ncbi:sigma factor-like helix-turn-helix DNA-binding protein, partial [Piscibacillus halophilus]
IIYLRYFKDQTQSEVAKRLNISQVQVSRLEKNILEHMGHLLNKQ